MQRLPIRSTSSNKLLAHFYISGCVRSTLHEARLSCQQLYAPTLYPVTASASCVARAVALCLESSDIACQARISDSTRFRSPRCHVGLLAVALMPLGLRQSPDYCPVTSKPSGSKPLIIQRLLARMPAAPAAELGSQPPAPLCSSGLPRLQIHTTLNPKPRAYPYHLSLRPPPNYGPCKRVSSSSSRSSLSSLLSC